MCVGGWGVGGALGGRWRGVEGALDVVVPQFACRGPGVHHGKGGSSLTAIGGRRWSRISPPAYWTTIPT